MRHFTKSLLVLSYLSTTLAAGATLKPETLAAWQHYLSLVNAALQNKSAQSTSFLQVDKEPNQLEAVKRGEIVVSQIKRHYAPITHGLIHDWVGTLFVPGTTLTDVFDVIRDYERYPQWYGPTVVKTHVLESHDNFDRYTIRYMRHVLFVTAALDAEYDVHFFRVSPTQRYSIGRSQSIQEDDKYSNDGKGNVAADNGNGYVWRVYTVTKYQQRDNGVYIEQENVALSRPIPPSLSWLVEPVVKRLAKELLEKPLEQTRDAVVEFERNKSKRTLSH